MSWLDDVQAIRQRRSMSLRMGGPERVQRQHDQGRLTVRERIAALVDPDSFVEVGGLAGRPTFEDGVLTDFTPAGFVAGLATIDGRDVAVGGEDFTVRGGSAGGGRDKGDFLRRMAKEYRLPLVSLADGAGANVQSIETLGHTYLPNGYNWGDAIELMAIAPVITAVLGSVAGLPAGRTMLSHWTVMVKNTSELFAAGPPVVRRAVGVEISKQDLGGSRVQVYESGVLDNEAEDEPDCFQMIRRFLSYMPRNVWELPPYQQPDDHPDRREEDLLTIVPNNRARPYDMRRLLRLVLDKDSFFEVQPHYGGSMITGFARLNGHVIGVVANNPRVNGGALDAAGADKQCHFLELSDYFRIPIMNFVDVPGFMIGPQAERSGTMRRGMRALWMAYQVTVPQIDIMVRRCYGMAGSATGNPSRLNLRLAWPSAEWGSIPIEGGVDAAFRREIENAPDPALRRAELEDRLRRLRSPMATAEAFGVEDIIDPRQTRPLAIRFLETALRSVRSEPLGPKPKYGVRP
jgi:acetyl-CoA carboxylase carboxyltransferase component